MEKFRDMNICVEELHYRIGSFFEFRSPLLEDFWPKPEPEVEEQVLEHIANHDFARYEQDDWYEREYQLHDGQDVLCGPESTTIDGVSIPVEASEKSGLYCGLCHNTDAPLRELKICGHEFCEDCLKNQLEAKYECRYKCVLCRAEFFPQTSAWSEATL
jgi:hypothetical protein